MSDNYPMESFSTTWFDQDQLPTELILEIFDYLSSNDIIYSFFDLNQRLHNLLLQSQGYINYLQLPTSNLDFWRKTSSVIGSQIRLLIIPHYYRTLSLDFFPNLKSIIINSPYGLTDGFLKFILQDKYFQKLHLLNIKHDILCEPIYRLNEFDDEQLLFKKVFSNENNLQIFEYLPLLKKLSRKNLEILNYNWTIHSLILNLSRFTDIFILIQYTPNLIYLNTQSEVPFLGEQPYQWEKIKKIQLKEFYLKFHLQKSDALQRRSWEIDFNQITRAIQIFSSSLITLSLNFRNLNMNNNDGFPFNGIKLEKQLLKAMIKLEKFYLYADTFTQIKDVQNILSTFKNQFWVDHNWNIGLHQSSGTYLYSLPFQFNELYGFSHFNQVLSNYQQILHNPRLWYNITSLELIVTNETNLKKLFRLIKINMPKLLSIKFINNNPRYVNSNNNDDNSFVFNDNIDVILNNVTTIHLYHVSMEKLKEYLIYALPDFKHLVLVDTKLPSRTSELASKFNKRIQRLTVDERFDIQKLAEENYIYFSELQDLQFTYGFTKSEEELEKRQKNVTKILKHFPNLKIISIYAIPAVWQISAYSPYCIFYPLVDKLDVNLKKNYEILQSGQYLRFVRKETF